MPRYILRNQYMVNYDQVYERPEVKDGEDLGLCKSEDEDSAKLGESDPGEDGAAHVDHSLPRVLHLDSIAITVFVFILV